jgi:hypothetical protein
MRILALMASNGEFVDNRPLSIAEAADRLGITLEEAPSRLRHPRAQGQFVDLVRQRSDRLQLVRMP